LTSVLFFLLDGVLTDANEFSVQFESEVASVLYIEKYFLRVQYFDFNSDKVSGRLPDQVILSTPHGSWSGLFHFVN